ncbi:deoxynucleotidyltransferase terminal-interacting protein 2 [Chanos chanos]|uniref:Deoxynucleotidyltransferase terminal-interacting protein 2 n=1 Tax=Chanos chanos TaxID=29144 RepID=A0A6J2WBZ9_CHACN|nr:deoxynucleotidyltransferase terminal-interacting protein 2 [Chanos chanos]
MVATRRGARVCSPTKNDKDQTSCATEPTPSTRRTRGRAVKSENQSQSEPTSDSQNEAKEEPVAPGSPEHLAKSKTLSRQRTRNANQQDSTNEADVSESESCCSTVSDRQAVNTVQPTPRGRRRMAVHEKSKSGVDDDVVSEADSCSSSVSASVARRATRSQRKLVPASSAAEGKEQSEAESCSSVVSLSKSTNTPKTTRGRRRTAGPSKDTEPSEAESCSSNVSGPWASTVRRSTRGQRGKPVEPIPIHLEENTDTSGSPLPRRTRGRTKKSDEVLSQDSEGGESGPSFTPRRNTRSQARLKPHQSVGVADSDVDSETPDGYSSLGSPCSTRERSTPCSSRTGSASSNRAFPSAAKTTETSDDKAETRSVPSAASAKPGVEEIKEGDLEEELAETHAEDVDMEEADVTVVSSSGDQDCTLGEENVTLRLDDDDDDVSVEITEANMSGPEIGQDQVTPPEDETTSKSVDSELVDEVGTITDDQKCSEQAVTEMLAEKGVRVIEESNENTKDLCSETVIVTEGESEDSTVVREDKQDAMEVDPHVDVTTADATTADNSSQERDAVSEEVAASRSPATEDTNVSSSTSVQVTVSAEETLRPTEGTVSQKPAQVSLLDSSDDEEESDGGLSAEEGVEEREPEDSGSDNEAEPGPSGKTQTVECDRLFAIDTRPGFQPAEVYYVDGKQTEEEEEEEADKDEAAEVVKADDDGEEEFVDEEGDDDDDEDTKVLLSTRRPAQIALSSSIDPGLKVKELGGLYINFDGSKSKTVSNTLKKLKDQKNQDELLKRSIISPDFEKKDAVPPYKESKHAAKLKRKEEREKTTGDGWFNMKAPELTEELKNDLKVLQMRSAVDPKRFYRKNDRKGPPKYFQVGTVVDTPLDFYHSRVPKKERKRTIVEELLADAEFRSYNKRKYQEIMSERAAVAAGHRKRKPNKFHKKKK